MTSPEERALAALQSIAVTAVALQQAPITDPEIVRGLILADQALSQIWDDLEEAADD